VKAIRIVDGHAAVMAESCVACGHCVQICPAGAKRVRNDVIRLNELLESGRPAYVSLAPSWVSEFQGVSSGAMNAALRRLGFAGASETALGAQMVSDRVAERLKSSRGGVHVSSACPAAVEFVGKHMADRISLLTDVYSPALSHALYLRRMYGDSIAVVLFSPCAGKKLEADRYPEILDLALTFDDLWRCLETSGIDLARQEPDGGFVPCTARDGAIYPLEGGMIETLRSRPGLERVRFFTFAGIPEIGDGLAIAASDAGSDVVFVETLACTGGCVNGPCSRTHRDGLRKRLEVLRRMEPGLSDDMAACRELDLIRRFDIEPWRCHQPSEREIVEALLRVGKRSKSDELNCGGCGYENCRAFAAALLAGNAEPSMCVSYLRQLAQKKANALLRCIPAGVVIADHELRIVECNERFARMFDDATRDIYEVFDSLTGACLDRIVPFADEFRAILQSGGECRKDWVRCGDRLLSVHLFTVEHRRCVGAVVSDVTSLEMRREQIASRAREVIDRNLATVQEIACRLGEHMADTEMLLRSIADTYADHTIHSEIREENP
jgi:PAS domain-containing protein